MGEIAGQNQPVSHPVLLTCGLCVRAGQRAAAGQAARAGAGLVTHRVSGPASSRGPLGRAAARCCRQCSPARPGACSPRASRGFPMPWPWPC